MEETKCEGFEDVAGGIVPQCLRAAAFTHYAWRGGLGMVLLSLPHPTQGISSLAQMTRPYLF